MITNKIIERYIIRELYIFVLPAYYLSSSLFPPIIPAFSPHFPYFQSSCLKHSPKTHCVFAFITASNSNYLSACGMDYGSCIRGFFAQEDICSPSLTRSFGHPSLLPRGPNSLRISAQTHLSLTPAWLLWGAFRPTFHAFPLLSTLRAQLWGSLCPRMSPPPFQLDNKCRATLSPDAHDPWETCPSNAWESRTFILKHPQPTAFVGLC